MPNAIIYPGTFDPITVGHIDLIERATKIFSKVIVAVAGNSHKAAIRPLEERMEFAIESLRDYPSVEICGFDNLLVEFAKHRGILLILRGLRAVSDFEYEFQLASMNRRIFPELETVFLTPAEKYSFISSSLVREIARLGGDVSQFVHPYVASRLREKYR